MAYATHEDLYSPSTFKSDKKTFSFSKLESEFLHSKYASPSYPGVKESPGSDGAVEDVQDKATTFVDAYTHELDQGYFSTGFEHQWLYYHPTSIKPILRQLEQRNVRRDWVKNIVPIPHLSEGYTILTDKIGGPENAASILGSVEKATQDTDYDPSSYSHLLFMFADNQYADALLPKYHEHIVYLLTEEPLNSDHLHLAMLGLMQVNTPESIALIKELGINKAFTDALQNPEDKEYDEQAINVVETLVNYMSIKEAWSADEQVDFIERTLLPRIQNNDGRFINILRQRYLAIPVEAQDLLWGKLMDLLGPVQYKPVEENDTVIDYTQNPYGKSDSRAFWEHYLPLLKSWEHIAEYDEISSEAKDFAFCYTATNKNFLEMPGQSIQLFADKYGIGVEAIGTDTNLLKQVISLWNPETSLFDANPISLASLLITLKRQNPSIDLSQTLPELIASCDPNSYENGYITSLMTNMIKTTIPGFEIAAGDKKSNTAEILEIYLALNRTKEICEQIFKTPGLEDFQEILPSLTKKFGMKLYRRISDPEYATVVKKYLKELRKQKIVTTAEDAYALELQGWSIASLASMRARYIELFGSSNDFSLTSPPEYPESDLLVDVNKEFVDAYKPQFIRYLNSYKPSVFELARETSEMQNLFEAIRARDITQFSIYDKRFELLNYLEPDWMGKVVEAFYTTAESEPYFDYFVTQVQEILDQIQAGTLENKLGLWKTSISMRRDGQLVEDQQMRMSALQTSIGPVISLEFKRTNQDEVNLEDLPTHDYRSMLKRPSGELMGIFRAIDEYWDENSEKFTIPKPILKEKFPFLTPKELRLMARLRADSVDTLLFLPTKRARQIQSEPHRVSGIRSIVLSDAVTLRIAAKNAPQAYKGYTRVDVDLSVVKDAQTIVKSLVNATKVLNLDTCLTETQPHDSREHSKNRLKWFLKQGEVSEAEVDNLQWREVCPGYHSYVNPGYTERLKRAGLTYFYSSVRTINGALGAIQLGLMSGNERRRRGLIRGGWSAMSDLSTGGSDYAFLRSATKGMGTDWDFFKNAPMMQEYAIIYDPSLGDRTDWFAYLSDQYGSTKKDMLENRLDPETFVARNTSSYERVNEVCFKKGIDPSAVVGVLCHTPESRKKLLHQLKSRGIKEINGLPVEKAITTSAKHRDVMQLLKSKIVSSKANYTGVVPRGLTQPLINLEP